MPDLVPADQYDQHFSRLFVVDDDGRSRRRVIETVIVHDRPSPRRVMAGVLAVVAATALHLQAQTQNPPLTFDAAFHVALRRNADLEGLRRQQAIWDAQHAPQAANPHISARADDDCAPTCARAARPIDVCATGPVREALPPISGSVTDSDVMAVAQIVRRNLRQAFYELMLSDDQVQETQRLIDFASQFRTVNPSDVDATGHSRRDALRVEIALSRARLELIRAQSRRRVAQAAVNAVLNRAPDVPVIVVGDLTDPVPLPQLAPAIALSKAMDVELRQLRHAVEVQRRARAASGRLESPARPRRTHMRGTARRGSAGSGNAGSFHALTNAALEQQIVQLDAARAARERALEGCMREGFVRIDTGRHTAHVKDALIAAGADVVMRTADRYRAGGADVLELLEAQRTLVDLRREYLEVLRGLRLSEADVEERLPALGLNV